MSDDSAISRQEIWAADGPLSAEDFLPVPAPVASIEAPDRTRLKWLAIAWIHVAMWFYLDLDAVYLHPIPIGFLVAMGFATTWAAWLALFVSIYRRRGFVVNLYYDRVEMPHLGSFITFDLDQIQYAGQPYREFGTQTFVVRAKGKPTVWLPHDVPGMGELIDELNHRRAAVVNEDSQV